MKGNIDVKIFEPKKMRVRSVGEKLWMSCLAAVLPFCLHPPVHIRKLNRKRNLFNGLLSKILVYGMNNEGKCKYFDH